MSQVYFLLDQERELHELLAGILDIHVARDGSPASIKSQATRVVYREIKPSGNALFQLGPLRGIEAPRSLIASSLLLSPGGNLAE